MTVKLVARTLDLVEVFATHQRPLFLSELAKIMDIPVSSCLGLVRTLLNRGYLYEVRKRGGYYPTRKLWLQAVKIDQGNPLLDIIHEHLVALQQQVNETIVLGKILNEQVMYLDVVESNQSIRYSVQIGETRPLHANSIARAILAKSTDEEVLQLLQKIQMEPYNEKTITSPEVFIANLQKIRKQGWGENIGDSVDDLAAIAMAFPFAGDWYGISIVGPMQRILKQWSSLPNYLTNTIEQILASINNVHSSSATDDEGENNDIL